MEIPYRETSQRIIFPLQTWVRIESEHADGWSESTIQLLELARGTGKRLVADMSSVEFLGSAAIGKIIGLHRETKEPDMAEPLGLASVSSNLCEVFRLMRLSVLIDTELDDDEDCPGTGVSA